MQAELIFRNGTIYTMEASHPVVEAVAVSGGKIIAAGTIEAVDATLRPGTRIIDLAGRTLIPGFNDAHIHLWKVGLLLTTMLDLRPTEAPTIVAIIDKYRARAVTTPPDRWITGRGYNHTALEEGRHPTRYDLDQASTIHPLILTHTSAHAMVANSRALELAGITADTPDPDGGRIERDEQGVPNGVLHETAMNAVNRIIPPASDDEFEAAVIAAGKHMLRLGVTSVTDPGLNPAQLAVYRALAERRRMPLRVNAMARRYTDDGAKVPLPDRFEGGWLRIDTVKLFADGGLSNGGAALINPYPAQSGLGEDYRGLLRYGDEQMRAMIWDIHRGGLRAAVHAIGDAAIEQVITAIEFASRRLVSRFHHRIEHFGLPTADHIARCKNRIAVVPQPVFIHALGRNFLNYVDPRDHDRLYPLRTLIDHGLEVALSTDAPVVPDANPLLGLQAAAMRESADETPIGLSQRVSVEEALPLYTRAGAQIAGEGHLKGTITPGKVADFAILSGDILRCPPDRLLDLHVEMTVIDGQIIG